MLLVKSQNLNLKRCIISQDINHSEGSKKLIDNGKRNVIEYSNTLQDDLSRGVDEHDLERIKYHVDTCYSGCKRKSDRANEKYQ